MSDLRMGRWKFTRLLFKWWQMGMIASERARWAMCVPIADALSEVEAVVKRDIEKAEAGRSERRAKNLVEKGPRER